QIAEMAPALPANAFLSLDHHTKTHAALPRGQRSWPPAGAHCTAAGGPHPFISPSPAVTEDEGELGLESVRRIAGLWRRPMVASAAQQRHANPAPSRTAPPDRPSPIVQRMGEGHEKRREGRWPAS